MENGGFGASGQSVVVVQNAVTNVSSIYFYNIADLNSGDVTFTLPMGAIGVSTGTRIGFDVYAYDNYFTGDVTDFLGGMKFKVGSARFEQATKNTSPFGSVARATSARVPFKTAVVPDADSTELGLLLMYGRNAGAESQAIVIPKPVP